MISLKSRTHRIIALTLIALILAIGWFMFFPWSPHQAAREITGLPIPSRSELVELRDNGWTSFSFGASIKMVFRVDSQALSRIEKEAEAKGYRRLPQQACQDPTLPAAYLQADARGWYFLEKTRGPRTFTMVIVDSQAGTVTITRSTN